MAIDLNSEDGKALRNLIPLENYPNAAFAELCTTISVEQAQDSYLFRKGDTATELVYLLSGSVTLQAHGLVVDVVEARSDSGRFALAHQIPRKIDALANGQVRFVRLNADKVNNPPAIETRENDNYTIIEENDADDWLNVLLRQALFQRLPQVNLQKLLVSIATVHFAAGEVIIEAGAPVESVYIVSRGQCQRNRPAATGNLERRIASGEMFGDEYLLLGIPSREQIMALTEVTLVELSKAQFFEHVIQPMLPQLSAEDTEIMTKDGALLLDVRAKHLAERTPLAQGIHIPYANLSMKLDDLDPQRKTITSADEKTSLAAAFLLLKHNYNVGFTSDGSTLVEPETAAEPEGKKLNSPDQAAAIKAATNTLPEPLLPASVEPVEEEIEQQPAKALDPKAELRFLRAENKRLTAYTAHLEEKITRLKLEKQKAEMRAQLLSLQLKKLKELMLGITKNKA